MCSSSVMADETCLVYVQYMHKEKKIRYKSVTNRKVNHTSMYT